MWHEILNDCEISSGTCRGKAGKKDSSRDSDFLHGIIELLRLVRTSETTEPNHGFDGKFMVNLSCGL